LSADANHPIANSYWLPGGQVLAGEYPRTYDEAGSTERLHALLASGLRSFVDLTEATEGLQPYEQLLASLAREMELDVCYTRLAVRDVSIPTVEVMRTILSHIETELAAGRLVYVHCLGGVGRTGTVVGCLLIEGGATGEEALAVVADLFETMSPEKVHRHRHDGSPQTEQQRQFVRAWNDGRSG
jgi:hypothetical protein